MVAGCPPENISLERNNGMRKRWKKDKYLTSWAQMVSTESLGVERKSGRMSIGRIRMVFG